MSDYMLCHYINQYAPGKDFIRNVYALIHLVEGGYVSKVIEDYGRKHSYLAVKFSIFCCLLILQGKP